MRTVGVGESATLTADPGTFLKVEVANSSGTLVDLTQYVVSVDYEDPTADEPVGACTVVFRRGTGASSLAPLMTADPPIDAGRALVVSVDAGAGTYNEVFRGLIDRTDWKERFPGLVSVDARDQAGKLVDTFIEEERTYGSDAGVALETVMQSLLDDNGFSAVTLYVPTATSAVVAPAYSQGQESLFSALRTLAESIGWTIRYRFIEGDGWRLTLFEPARSKSVADRTFGTSDYYDVGVCDVDVAEIINVWEIVSPNADGSTGSDSVESASSIAAYGGVRRYAKITEGSDSPIVGTTKRQALINAALSDTALPDLVFEITSPYYWAGEVGVDLYSYTANDVHFSANQTLAPNRISHHLEVGQRPETRIGARGKPSGGLYTWQKRAQKIPSNRGAIDEEYGLVDVREVAASAAGKRRFAWTRRGRQVASVWYGYDTFPAPWSADNWPLVAAQVVSIPPDQNYVEIDVPAANEVGALQIEPRLSTLKVHSDLVIWQREIYPVPANIDVDLSAAIVSNAVDLTLKLTAAAGSNPYPATANVYEDSEAGTLLASFTITADGTKTKADDTDLGGRTLPAQGKRAWVAVVTDVTGTVYRDKAEVNAPRNPYFDGVRSTLSADLLSVDIYGTITDPAGLGGTLEYWLPTDETTPADPSGAATGSVIIAAGSMPYTMSPATIAAFDNVTTAGNSFTVVLRFIASDGRSTGKIPFPLSGTMQFLVDAVGQLRAESVHNGLVLAPQYRPYYLGTGAPTLTPADYGTNRYFDTAALQPYSHNGTSWATDDTTPAVSYAPILRAGVVTAEVIDATAVRAKLVGAERITADNITAALALEVGQYVQSTSYSAGSAGWRINADGSVEFNSGTFRGTVTVGSSTTYEAGYNPSTKVTTYRQASAPTATAVGDLWVDTDDSNHPYRWDGASWLSIRDAGAGTAVTGASIQRATSAPSTRADGSSLQSGDMWIDTDDGDKPYVWDGAAWDAVLTIIDGGRITTGTIAAGVVFAGEVSGNTFSATTANFNGALNLDVLGGTSPSGVGFSYGLSPTEVGRIRAVSTSRIGVSTNFRCELDIEIDGDLDHDGSGVGFYGVSPTTRQTIAASATDAATTQTLANDIRSKLITLGLVQA